MNELAYVSLNLLLAVFVAIWIVLLVSCWNDDWRNRK